MTLPWTGLDRTGDTSSLLELLWQTLRARGSASSPGPSVARDSAAALAGYCLSPEFDWADNAEGLNPCELARVHADVCAESSSYYPLPALYPSPLAHYPSLTRIQASACTCSVPVYNLIQVCAACQQPPPSGPTIPFYDFTANCSWRSLSFPYSSPSPLPDWARIDPFGGSINVSVAFHQVTGNGGSSSSAGAVFSSPSSSPLPPASTASPPQTASAPSSSFPAMSDGHLGHNPAARDHLNMGALIGAVVVAVVALGAIAGIVTWLRRKRRTRRQGTRLGSTTDLVGPDEHKGTDGGGGMREKAPGRDDTSLFVPTESFMSSRPSRSDSRTDSFTTNSSSSQSHDYRAFLVGEGASSTRFGTSYTGTESSGTETETASQSFDSRSRSTGRDSLSVNLDDDDDGAVSPFADVHRAPSSRSASSRLTMSDTGSYPAAAVLRAKFAPAAHQRLSVATMASLTPSATSVDAPSTTSSRAAPSSTGAVYGRDDDASSFDSRRD